MIKNRLIFKKYINILLMLLIFIFIIKNKIIINNKFTYEPKVCMCMICKQENLYIKYFIDYYKKLGLTKIIIYDNNDLDGEKLEDVIKDEIDKGYVTIINYRGDRGNGYVGGQQMKAYYDCYKKNNLYYDWFTFFDADEYLALNKENNIQQFLTSSRYDKCELVKVNVSFYTDNNQLEFEDKPLMERFTEKAKNITYLNKFAKIIARGNLTNQFVADPHSIFISNKSCDSNGNFTYGLFINPPIYKYASLNHYSTKTIKEYCFKLRRGDAFYNFTLDDIRIKLLFSHFFKFRKS